MDILHITFFTGVLGGIAMGIGIGVWVPKLRLSPNAPLRHRER